MLFNNCGGSSGQAPDGRHDLGLGEWGRYLLNRKMRLDPFKGLILWEHVSWVLWVYMVDTERIL